MSDHQDGQELNEPQEGPQINPPGVLPGDKLQEKYHERFVAQMKAEEEEAKKKREFKAAPVPDIYPKTYAQQMSQQQIDGEQELTDEAQEQCVSREIMQNAIGLASERRAKERALFEQYKQRKQEIKRQVQMLEQEERKRINQLEAETKRKAMQYKAKPYIPRKDDFPKVSARPVTKPVSPIFIKRTFQLFKK